MWQSTMTHLLARLPHARASSRCGLNFDYICLATHWPQGLTYRTSLSSGYFEYRTPSSLNLLLFDILPGTYHQHCIMSPLIQDMSKHNLQWGKFKTSYMYNNIYHLRRTKFIVYQLATNITAWATALRSRFWDVRACLLAPLAATQTN